MRGVAILGLSLLVPLQAFIQDDLPRKVGRLIRSWDKKELCVDGTLRDLEGGTAKTPAKQKAGGKERRLLFSEKVRNPFAVSVLARSEGPWSLTFGDGRFRIRIESRRILLRENGRTVQKKSRRVDLKHWNRITLLATTSGIRMYLNDRYGFMATFVETMEGKVGVAFEKDLEVREFTVWHGPRIERPEAERNPAGSGGNRPSGPGDLGVLSRWKLPKGAKNPGRPCGCDENPVAPAAVLEKSIALDITIAIQPDAPPEFYPGLQNRFQMGSEKLFELTEGQMYIRSAIVRDKTQSALIVIPRLDGPFLYDGQPVAGQVKFNGRNGVMLLPGVFDPYTFVHEAGHLWLGLPDEYGERKTCECVMSAGSTMRPFFCDDRSNHTGEGASCWSRILKVHPNWKHPNDFSGTAPKIQWQIQDQ